MSSNDLVLMGFDDLIPIIFIIIFFVFPIIGRIVESLNGNAKKKSESSSEVKEYLQKMRGQQARSNQYRAPATKPGGNAMSSDLERGRKRKAKSGEQADLEQIGLSLEPAKPAAAVTLPKEEAAPAVHTTPRGARRDGLRTRVLEAPRLSDVQKAMVLKEIFSKPKSLLLKRE